MTRIRMYIGITSRLLITALIMVLFTQASHPSPAIAQTGTPIRVLQYNVQFLTPWDGEMVILAPSPVPIYIPREIPDHWPNVSTRAKEIGQAIACYDIVALQEVPNDTRRHEILSAMEEYGRDCDKDYIEWVSGPDLAGGIKVPNPSELFDIFNSGKSTPVIDDELAIVSRFPIIGRHALIYEVAAGVDAFAAKGVLHARLWRGGESSVDQAIDVFVTHLQAGGKPDIQREQIDQLAAFMRAHSSPGIPIMLMGDFNIKGETSDEMYNYLINSLADLDLIDIGMGLGGTNEDNTRRIDYIFTSQDGLTVQGTFNDKPVETDLCKYEDTDINRNPRVNKFCSDNWPKDTMSDHSAVEALMVWQDKSVTPPPAIDEPKILSVTVTQLQARSTDSCNQFMDFFGTITLGNLESGKRKFGIIEGNDIGPDWSSVPKRVEANFSPINAHIDIRDDDDFFCGGGDDDVDVNPSPSERKLWLQIDLVENGVNLVTRDGQFIERLGRINQPIFVEGTSDDERGRMTFIVRSEPVPDPPPPLPHKVKDVTVRVLRLQAKSTDSCNERMDFYGLMSLQNGFYDFKDFGITEGNDITPGWSVNNLVAASEFTVNFSIRVVDEDDFFCGGGDDEVDVSPDTETALLGGINIVTGEIYLRARDGTYLEHLGYVQQVNEESCPDGIIGEICAEGTNGDETARMRFQVTITPDENILAFAHVGIWHDNFCITNEICQVGDFNGDDKDDIVAFVRNAKGGEETGDVWVALSNGANFEASSVWHPHFCIGNEICKVGDFNGDGQDDIVAFVRNDKTGEEAGDVWVALSNGTSFEVSRIWHDHFCITNEICQVGDFNGDGKDDIAAFVRNAKGGEETGDVWVALSNGSGFEASRIWHDHFCITNEICQVGDFNGDGKDDIVAFVRNAKGGEETGDVWVALSNGSGFEASRIWHYHFCITNEICQVGDFNGDGKDDIAAFVTSTQSDDRRGDVWVGLSNGESFSHTTIWNDFLCFAFCETGDFDGNRADDVISFTPGGPQFVGQPKVCDAHICTMTIADEGNVYVGLSTSLPPPVPEPEPAPHVNLSLRQFTSSDFVVVGDVLTYTLRIENLGNLAAQNVSLSDTLPVSLMVKLVQTDQGSCKNDVPITCHLGTVSAKATALVKIVTEVESSDASELTADAVVSSSNEDADSGDNSDTTSVTILPVPQITVSGGVGTGENECSINSTFNIPLGSIAYYCYRVTNTGPITVQTHTITDNVLGELLRDKTFILEPDESITTLELGLIISKTIDFTETIVSQATWVSSITSGPSTTAGATVTARPVRQTWLPMILKDYRSAPDLVIDSLIATTNSVTITFSNQGDVPVNDAFWLDVYFNPRKVPGLNEPCDDTIAEACVVWGIEQNANHPINLLIQPGETRTLTLANAFFGFKGSHSPPYPVGVNVYAQVDSVDFNTNHGAVLENREDNNLFGPIISVIGIENGFEVISSSDSLPRGDLPPRE